MRVSARWVVAGWLVVGGWVAGCGGGGGGTPPVDYDLNRAIELARLSLYAYQQLNDFEAHRPFTPPAGYQLVSEILTSERYPGDATEEPGAERIPIAYIASKGDTLYVVFRGTRTISEWLKNVKLAQRAYDFIPHGGNTEKGFTEIYGSIHEDIISAVADVIAAGGITQLFVTGHSLGAALATLAAPELADRVSIVPQMYNFASPRVGNPTFSGRYRDFIENSARVVNTRDEVPKLPPTTVITPDLKKYHYVHVRGEERITFGKPLAVTDPNRIEENHSLCGYYDALCEQLDTSDDITQCRHNADGADGCNS